MRVMQISNQQNSNHSIKKNNISFGIEFNSTTKNFIKQWGDELGSETIGLFEKLKERKGDYILGMSDFFAGIGMGISVYKKVGNTKSLVHTEDIPAFKDLNNGLKNILNKLFLYEQTKKGERIDNLLK